MMPPSDSVFDDRPRLLLAYCVGLIAFLALVATTGAVWAKPGDEAAKPADVSPQQLFDNPPAESAPPAAAPEDKNSPASPPAESPPSESPAPRPGGELPWIKRKRNEPLPVIRPPSGVREILERYDIGASQLEGFFNGQPISVAEEETLVRIMYRLPRIGLENLEKWRRKDVDLDRLVVDPAHYRLDVMPLQGRLVGVEKREVSPELGRRLEIKHFYLARVDLTGQGYEALVALRRVPEWWLGDPEGEGAEGEQPELNEPVSFDGIFLKVAETSEEKPQLLFLSRRLRWLPDAPQPERFIGNDQLRLSKLGLDLTLLDELRTANRRDIGDIDREPMYQLLYLVGKATPQELKPEPPRVIDVVPLLEEPEKHQGELMTVPGFARRITKVVVDDADIRTRFNIDHYFMIDMAVNLGERSIRFGSDPTGEKNAVFYNDFPVTLCVRELPDDLQPQDEMRELITANAIFMKTWSYRSNYMARFDNQLQVAPLLIAKMPHRVKLETPHNWVADALVGFVLVVTALIVGAVFWWFRSSDRSLQQTLQELDERGERPSFKGLEDVPTKPDFSGLEAHDAGPTPPKQEE
jgi:hypothetical protein